MLCKFSENQLIENLHRISNGELTYNRVTPDGIIAYHSPHRRQELVYPTKDLEEASERIRLGWQLKYGKEGILLRAPEEWLCDLSDPFKASCNGIVENLALYLLLHSLKSSEVEELMERASKKFPHLRVYLLEGESIETQIRIAGTDRRVKKLREEIFKTIKERVDWEWYMEKAKSKLNPRQLHAREVKINRLKPMTKEFYLSIKKFHEVISPLYEFSAYTGFWESVPNADIYAFIPKSGFRLALGFVDTREKYDDVFFWEYHAGQVASLPEIRLFFRSLEGKKTMIVDYSYSGATLNSIAQRISDEGGKPVRLAVFPKSKRAIYSSEYLIFLDRVLSSEKVELSGNDWAVEVYCDVINNRR
jgi:hypothetical protein